MAARTTLLCIACLTAGCATVQENPNYTFSSKYDAAQTTQMADATPPVQRQTLPNTQRETLQAADRYTPPAQSPTELAYDADRMVGTPGYEAMRAQEQGQSQPQPQRIAPAPAQPRPVAPRQLAQAPAPQQAAPVPMAPSQATPIGAQPRAVTYDYGRNMAGQPRQTRQVEAPAPQPQQIAPAQDHGQDYVPAQRAVPVSAQPQAHYTVQPGDTVYSLSRRLCVPLSEITLPNGIGQDYAIGIGQTLIVPGNRC